MDNSISLDTIVFSYCFHTRKCPCLNGLFYWFLSLHFSVGINNDLLIASAKPALAFSKVDLDKLRTAADFKLYTPSYSVQSYKLEINPVEVSHDESN